MECKPQNLDEYIKRSGLKINYIAEKLGISRQALNKKRKGITDFKSDDILILCDVLKIPDKEVMKIFFNK